MRFLRSIGRLFRKRGETHRRVAGIVLAALLARHAAAVAIDPQSAALYLAATSGLSFKAATLVALALPYVEGICALALIFGIRTDGAAALALVLCLAIAALVLWENLAQARGTLWQVSMRHLRHDGGFRPFWAEATLALIALEPWRTQPSATPAAGAPLDALTTPAAQDPTV